MYDRHHQSEAAIQQLLVRCTAQAMFAIDCDGICTYANDAASHALRMRATEMVGEPLHPLIHHHRPDGSRLPVNECPIDRAMRREETVRVDRDVFWDSEGDAVAVSYVVSPLRDDGRLLGAVVAFDELTDDAEQQEQEVDAILLDALVNSMPDAVLAVSPDRRILHYNDRFLETWKLPREVVERRDDEEVLQLAKHQLADPEGFVERVHRAYAQRSRDVHERIAFTDGRVVDRYGGPIYTDGGHYCGYLWLFHDVSEDAHRHERREREVTEVRARAEARSQQAWHAGDEYERALRDYHQLMRHRIANPLTTLLVGIQTLRELRPDEETAMRVLDAMQEQGRELRRVVLEQRAVSPEEDRLHPGVNLARISPEAIARAREKEARIARLNEQMLRELGDVPAEREIGFLCECSALTCTDMIHMSPRQYRAVHEAEGHYVVISGHFVEEIDEVVEQRDDHLVVRKIGAGQHG